MDFEEDLKSIKSSIYDMNMVLKGVYDHYCYNKGVIVPSDMNSIKNPELFSNSVMIHKEPVAFLDGAMIDPVELSKGIQKTGVVRIFESDSTKERVIVTKKDEMFKYGVSMDEFQLEDIEKYPGLKTVRNCIPDEYPITWTMDEATKTDLLEYRVPCICLGEFNGEEVNLIAAVKLFPAIKKADAITIYAMPIIAKDRIYEILIVSTGNQWSFYSVHRIVNIDPE